MQTSSVEGNGIRAVLALNGASICDSNLLVSWFLDGLCLLITDECTK